jgi:starvation-inducible DNA-binding protein
MVKTKDKQIDRMMDDGLGAGMVVEQEDRKKLQTEAEKNKSPLAPIINKQVADWSVLYIKLHNYHWYVEGEHFFTLHAKFEELYTQAAVYIDDLAERLLALHGKPVATMKEFLEISTIEEATCCETPEQMVQSLVRDFTTIISDLKDGMQSAEQENDETTGDMLLSIHAHLEKEVWMFNAFLRAT